MVFDIRLFQNTGPAGPTLSQCTQVSLFLLPFTGSSPLLLAYKPLLAPALPAVWFLVPWAKAGIS